MEDETERQGGFDGEIGILELPAPPADASRCPRGDRVGREPEGDVASPHEGSVVLGPVPDAILCRVLRMHSRLHSEIMTRRRSRWSTCRPLLAHRAESAHQRPATPWARPVPPAARWDVARLLSVSSVIHDRPSTPRSRSWTVRACESEIIRPIFHAGTLHAADYSGVAMSLGISKSIVWTWISRPGSDSLTKTYRESPLAS